MLITLAMIIPHNGWFNLIFIRFWSTFSAKWFSPIFTLFWTTFSANWMYSYWSKSKSNHAKYKMEGIHLANTRDFSTNFTTSLVLHIYIYMCECVGVHAHAHAQFLPLIWGFDKTQKNSHQSLRKDLWKLSPFYISAHQRSSFTH